MVNETQHETQHGQLKDGHIEDGHTEAQEYRGGLPIEPVE